MTTTTSHPVDSTTRPCCGGIGRHTDECRVPTRCPTWCPTWCVGDHVAGVIESGPDGSQEHFSSDHGGGLPRLSVPATGAVIRRGGGTWRAEIRADDAMGWRGMPFVPLYASTQDSNGDNFREVSLDFTPGEALELAHVLATLAHEALMAGIKRTEIPA